MSELEKISKYLSYVLRHAPDSIQLAMDEQGWVAVEELIAKTSQFKNLHLTLEQLDEIVQGNDKQRFAFTRDKTRIRANQGHSITVKLDLLPTVPPDILYHGTASRFMDIIEQQGLKPMTRHHVHLSACAETAIAVGQRYGITAN